MSTLGTLTLDLAFVFLGVTVLTALWGRHTGSGPLLKLSERSVYLVAALLTLSVLTLLALVFSNDFSVKMVQASSSRTLPWHFKASLLWVNLESSMLFWAWILSLASALAVRAHRRTLADLVPMASVVLMVVLGFFLYLLQFHKNPFDEYLVELPTLGNGMRPLLRNPWMLVHPPAQYFGYIGTTVPFAFAIAALLRPEGDGSVSDDWVRSMRPWILGSWLFLGLGLVLGMVWAYELIDWGGWWSWDPIENAALFPWFVATALVHSALILLRRGMFRGATYFLILTTFWFTILGTFMTRAGFVRSVHAFGKDAGLFWAFIIFMGLGVSVSYGLLIARMTDPRKIGRRITSFISLQVLFVATNFLLFLMSLFVLTVTLFPSVSKALGGKDVTLGPPFYERTMAPAGLLLLLLTALAPVVSWGGMRLKRLGEQLFAPFLVLVATVLALTVAWPETFPLIRTIRVGNHAFQMIGVNANQLAIGLSAMLAAGVVQQLWRLARARARARAEHRLLAIWRTLVVGRRRYGAYLVHLGVALMFLGFAGKPLVQKTDRVLSPGQRVQVAGMELEYAGLTFTRGADADATHAVLLLRKPGDSEATSLLPTNKTYHDSPRMPMSEPTILRGIGRDLHVRLANRTGRRVTLKVAVHPLVSWLWIGFLVMILGAVICITPRLGSRPQQAERANVSGWLRWVRWGALGAWTLWAAGLVVYLASTTHRDHLGATVMLWLVGVGSAGIALLTAWSFAPLVLDGAPRASARGGDEAPVERRDQLVLELRQLEEDIQTGKLQGAEADAALHTARWELAVLLATEDAEARRDQLRQELQQGLQQELDAAPSATAERADEPADDSETTTTDEQRGEEPK